VEDFFTWLELNHLQLNVAKTKELLVDLRRTKAPVTPVLIQGASVDIVQDYKYLGIHIDYKLGWATEIIVFLVCTFAAILLLYMIILLYCIYYTIHYLYYTGMLYMIVLLLYMIIVYFI